MKHLKFLFPVLLCTLLLGLSSCKETNAARLRAMRGDWESVKNRPAFTLFEENGLSGNFWLVSFKISYLCLPLFYETRTTPSCHPSGCAYRQL